MWPLSPMRHFLPRLPKMAITPGCNFLSMVIAIFPAKRGKDPNVYKAHILRAAGRRMMMWNELATLARRTLPPVGDATGGCHE
jgi:hypothetical protein